MASSETDGPQCKPSIHTHLLRQGTADVHTLLQLRLYEQPKGQAGNGFAS